MSASSIRAVFDSGIAWVSRGAAVVAGACFVYVLVGTTLGVINRKILETPSRFLFDSVEVAMGITVFLSLAFVALKKGHVRMELLPDSRVKLRNVLDRIAAVLSSLVLGTYAVVAFKQFTHDFELGIKIGSNIGLPRWIPMLALALGLLLFALALLRKGALISDAEEQEGV